MSSKAPNLALSLAAFTAASNICNTKSEELAILSSHRSINPISESASSNRDSTDIFLPLFLPNGTIISSPKNGLRNSANAGLAML